MTTPLIKQQTTYEDILNWRLHWLYCDLIHNDKLVKVIQTQQAIDDAINILNLNIGKFNTLVWEFSTMMGFDLYETEVMRELEQLEKYCLYKDTFSQIMSRIVSAQQTLNANHLTKMIDNVQCQLKFKLTSPESVS